MKRVVSLVIICFIAALARFPSSAHAGALTPGIIVSPALEQLTVSAGETNTSFTAKVTNNLNSAVVLNMSAVDFTTLNQNGGVSFLATKNNPHGLASSVSMDTNAVQLAPGQSQNIIFTINKIDTLASGGHYGAIIYKILGPDLTPFNTVTVNQAVTTLIFLKTAGQGTQDLNLVSLGLDAYQATFPDKIDAIFENTGNTQTAARGYVQIVDSAGTIVSQGVVNVDSGLILPGSKRLFPVSLSRQNNATLWPGMYHAKISYRYDGQGAFLHAEETFLYVSWQHILFIVVCLALCAGLILLLRKTLFRRRPRLGRP